ncbi:MAG: hypothetical protein KDA75_09500 [Planctomycetaceae bacterium]|nr:hypothetical protein [Planctomycetaceae bacterium]
MQKLIVAAVVLFGLASQASADSRTSTYTYRGSSSSMYSSPSYSSSSSTPFLYRGYNPGHIFGNTVRRMYWGPQMGPRR